jgi:hypothetical protein
MRDAVQAASRATPMSKTHERGGRVRGFSTGVQKDILVSLPPSGWSGVAAA